MANSVLKPGDIAYVRTTGEPVFVIAVREDAERTVVMDNEDVIIPLKTKVLIRQPIVSDRGVLDHKLTAVFLEELETKEDRLMRDVEEINTMKARMGKKENAAITDRDDVIN